TKSIVELVESVENLLHLRLAASDVARAIANATRIEQGLRLVESPFVQVGADQRAQRDGLGVDQLALVDPLKGDDEGVVKIVPPRGSIGGQVVALAVDLRGDANTGLLRL